MRKMVQRSKFLFISLAVFFILHSNSNQQLYCLCTNLLECLSLGKEIIKPRYITNLQGFHDRTTKYKDEFYSDANFKADTMKLEVKNVQDEEKLKKEIHKLTLAEKIRQIIMLKKKTKEIHEGTL